MPEQILIVDGYNVIHCVPRFEQIMDKQSLERSREVLLGYCSEWIHRRRDTDRCYVVFDGDDQVIGKRATSSPGVQAVYSRTGETADDRIGVMLERADRRDRYTVVSDDKEVRTHARTHRMEWMSAGDFCRAPVSKSRGAARSGTSDDKDPLDPRDAAAINAELRRHYGIE